MNSELDVRPYQRGDEKHIIELFRRSYGYDLNEGFWPWRFRDNPTGAGLIDLCWDNDVLAAHYAVTPALLRVSGRDYTAGLSGTTMTHPDYKGRGLFPILARNTYARMAAANMMLVWGFPNRLSHQILTRHVDWIDIYEVPLLRLVTEKGSSLPKPVDSVAELPEFDSRFDRLWELVRDDYPVTARRDQRQLSWRYLRNPTEKYRILAYLDNDELLGYAVFKRYHEEIQVVDVLARKDAEIGLQLVYQVVQIAREEAAQAVSLWLNVTHPLHHALEKLGFMNGEPVTYFCARLLQNDSPKDVISDFRNWYLTMGDSDVF